MYEQSHSKRVLKSTLRRHKRIVEGAFFALLFITGLVLNCMCTSGCATLSGTAFTPAALEVEQRFLGLMAANATWNDLYDNNPQLRAYVRENRKTLKIALTRATIHYVALLNEGYQHEAALDSAVGIAVVYVRGLGAGELEQVYIELVYAQNPTLPPTLREALGQLVGPIALISPPSLYHRPPSPIHYYLHS